MGGSQKCKRITWAPDVNLCQVRLFSSAKPPSEVGVGNRPSWSGVYEADESFPPGFENMKPTILKLPQKALTKWRCPPRFEVNREWQVVSGEESNEIESQNQRERTVLEAIYPWSSAIPPNPRLPMNVQESISGDHKIPLIPLTPIEEANAGLASSFSQTANSNPPMIPQPQHHFPNGVVSSQCSANSIAHANGITMQPDIAEAALAAVLSNSSNEDQTNLIDCDLLIRILSNPKVLQQVLNTSHSMQEMPSNISAQQKNSSNSTNIAMNGGASLSAQTMKPELNAPHTTIAAPPQHKMGFVSTCSPPVADVSSAPSTCMVKDISYYKDLIQQHGGSKGGGVPTQSCGKSKRVMGGAQEFTKSRDHVLKSRTMKPCMYFNTPRGCRNGANCAYQHDIGMLSSRKRVGCVTEVVGAKRVKLSR